ncbi:MAG: thiamine pyrophosphate-binding protein [Deltaproteobacteria bacterium]|nr:thiamine pyrophosphate-binding protein [Candidatus Zymogenaceae bacterium]
MPKATEVMADILVQAGIEYIFGIPGGCTPFLFEALEEKQDKIKMILSRQEGTASCMADMYGRITGKPAVIMGQGAWMGSNAAFGIMEAYLAGVPMLIITETSDYASLPLHQPYQNATGDYGAFDLPSIMRSMTKFTTVATNASEFAHGIQLAIKHATTGKPGPAAVIIRWSVISEELDPDTANPRLYPIAGHLNVSPPSITMDDADRIADMLIAAKNPVMITGRGIHAAKAYAEVQETAELLGMPVATSYMGKSTIPEVHDLALGTTGIIGQKAANERVTNADVIFAVGTGLAPENMKMLSPDFIRPMEQKIIQVDIEPLHVGWTYPVTIGVTSEAKCALRAIIDAVKERNPKIDVKKRIEEVKAFKKAHGYFENISHDSTDTPIPPGRIVGEVSKVLGPDDLLVLDAGNNRIFFTHLFQSTHVGQIFAGGGAAAMGWGPPAALAAQLLNPKKRVMCPTGDGCMFMALSCLETAVQYDIPVTYVILNNSVLGNVNDFMNPQRRKITEYNEPDLASLAKASGWMGIKVKKPQELEPALREAVESERPALVDITTLHQPHFTMMPF